METIKRYLQAQAEEYYETGAAAAAGGSPGSNTSASSSTGDDGYYNSEGYDDEYSYDGYAPTTYDPDWWFTGCIMAGCLMINLSLPLWIYLGNCLGFDDRSRNIRRRNKKSMEEWENNHDNPNQNAINENNNKNNDDNNNNNNNISGEDILIKQLDDARSAISVGRYSYTPGDYGDEARYYSNSLTPGGNGGGSIVSDSIARSRAGTHIGFTHHKNRLDAPGSVFSGTSGFTDAVLFAKPKRSRHAGRRAGKTKRIITTKSAVMGDDCDDNGTTTGGGGSGKLDVRMAAEFTKAEIDIHQQRQQQAASATVFQRQLNQQEFNTITPTTSSEIDSGSAVDDSRCDASILSKLDADAISVQDAVDARDGGMISPLDNNFNGKNNTNNFGIVGGAGDNMLKNSYGCHHIPMLERLLEIVDWDKEMKKYLTLAGHYSVQGILVEILGLVEISLIGHLMGISSANAYIIVGVVTGFTGTITTGFYECAGVLIPQANGTRNYLLIGRYMQLGMVFYCIATLPAAIFWCFYTEKAIIWYGFDAKTAAIGYKYLLVTLPNLFTSGIDAVLYELLNTVGRHKYATTFTLVSSIVHTSIIAGMLFYGVKDLWVLGLFEMLSETVCLIINFAIMVYNGWLDEYWEGLFKTNGLKDLRAVKNVFSTAIPLSFAWLLTYGEWEVMTFFARAMGNGGAEVAAWGLMGYLWSAFETLTNGCGDAAEVRVGFRMGSGQVRLAKLCADKAMYVSFTVAVYATGILFILAMWIPGWLTPDPTLQKMLFDIIPLIGFGQILMVWGMVAWAVLGAQGRIRIATALEFFISWGIGAPVAAIMTFVFNYNLEGIVAAMTISYTIGTNIYLYMLHTSDWEALSAIVVARNVAEGQTFSEFDWSELPENIRDAAIALGYNKSMWETGEEEPESNEKMWEELSSVEQKAAGLLGYTKKTWNHETDTVSSVEEKMPYDGLYFDKLPLEANKAAVCLGYNKEIWDSDGKASADSKKWNELTPAEQKAAEVLGYDSRKWAVTHGQDFSVVNDDWASLSKEAKSAAKVLGYTASIWNNDGSVPAEDKDWNELTSKQRAAAETLGYTEKKWNGDDDDDDDSESDDTPKVSLSKGALDQIISVSDPSTLLESINKSFETDNRDSVSSGILSMFGFKSGEKSKESSSK